MHLFSFHRALAYWGLLESSVSVLESQYHVIKVRIMIISARRADTNYNAGLTHEYIILNTAIILDLLKQHKVHLSIT